MKRILLLIFMVSLTVSSCQKEDILASESNEVCVTLSANIASSIAKSINDFGNGQYINRYTLEIYVLNNGDYTLYGTETKFMSDDGTVSLDFSLALMSNQVYRFITWADYSEDGSDKFYGTQNSLENITLIGDYDGLDERRDAFYAVLDDYTLTSESNNISLTLKRPFAQLNVSTYLTGISPSESTPKLLTISYQDCIPSSFNTLTGQASDYTSKSFTSTVIYDYVDAETLMHLCTDYIFVSAEQTAELNFSIQFFSDSEANNSIITNDKFVNIPIKANYATNVSGELLSETILM